MSAHSSIRNSQQQHKKQPIHFYQSIRQNMPQFYSIPVQGISNSPLKYGSLKNYSPDEVKNNRLNNKVPQLEINSQKIINSPKLYQTNLVYQNAQLKYKRFSQKIQILQKNLNRLYGQHESLKQLFDRSRQLQDSCKIFQQIQKCKQKIQQIKINKFIKQKRMEARSQLLFEEYFDKFSQLQKQVVVDQGRRIYQIEKILKSYSNSICNSNQQIKLPQNLQKKYANVIENNSNHQDSSKSLKCLNRIDLKKQINFQLRLNIFSHLKQVKQNIQTYITEIANAQQIQNFQFMKKINVQKIIQKRVNLISKKVQNISINLGELKCLNEYQMFIQKQNKIKHQILGFQSNKNKSQDKQNQLHAIQIVELKILNEQAKFIKYESIDRISYRIALIDKRFTQILQVLFPHSNLKKDSSIQLNQPQQKLINKKIQISKQGRQKYIQKVKLLQKQLLQTHHQILGLRSCFKKLQFNAKKIIINLSNREISASQNQIINKSIQNCQFQQIISDLIQKMGVLGSNISFVLKKQAQVF